MSHVSLPTGFSTGRLEGTDCRQAGCVPCVTDYRLQYRQVRRYRLQTGSCVPCVTDYRLQYRQVRRYRLQTGSCVPCVTAYRLQYRQACPDWCAEVLNNLIHIPHFSIWNE